MVSCKVSYSGEPGPASRSSSTKVNPDDIIDVRIQDDVTPLAVQDPAPARDSEEIDNSLTPFELMAQKMLDSLREAFNLDPTGEHRAVAVMVTIDKGKVWNVMADSTESQDYTGQEVWGKAYVEAEVAKTKTAFHDPTTKRASPI